MTKKLTPKNLIGAAVQKIRTEQRIQITQEDFVKRLAGVGLKIDRTVLARIENGKRKVSDVEVVAFARALRVPIGELFGFSGEGGLKS